MHGKNTLIKTSRHQSLLLVAMVSITPEDKVLSDLGLAPCQDRIGAPKEQVAAFSEEGEAIRGFFK